MTSRKTRKRKKANDQSTLKNEIISLFIIAMGILIMISLQTKSTGQLGKYIKSMLMGLLSIPAYVLPYFIILLGIFLMVGKVSFFDKKFKISITFLYIGYVMLYGIYSLENIPSELSFQNIELIYYQGTEGIGGGLIGSIFALLSIRFLGINGSYVVIITMMMIAFLVITRISLVNMLKRCREIIVKFCTLLWDCVLEFVQIPKTKEKKNKKEKNISIEECVEPILQNKQLDEKIKILDFTREVEGDIVVDETSQLLKNNDLRQVAMAAEEENDVEDISYHIKKTTKCEVAYRFPSLNLLQDNPIANTKNDKKEILHKAKILEQTLGNFGVDAKVIQVSKGPTITRYEIQPSPGVKVSKIVNLSDDIALNLAACNIRIEAPIPGKAAVGIEIPNDNVSMVTIKEVLESEKFINSDSKLTFVLGKDIAGNPMTADLAKMPHMLIAGATGSGKSVCINTFITSILYKATPEEVKLLLVDPKVVELNNYNGIPHLLIPVVTDPKKASSALNWAVTEMTNRYKYFAQNSVRDINGYNEKMKNNGEETLPKIVIIIDELADLMMVSPGQVEDSICRLAQMARAAGIHLIVATQRPSVDVITGVIKANIPSRIAFAVSSQMDSRTILDMGGAEKLLGKGDMLFYPVGASKPIRVQGAFITDGEVEKIVNFVKEQDIAHKYEEDIIEKVESNLSKEEESLDELLKDAIELVIEVQQASISMLQRRFRIGYNRAARLIDAMEERNIVGQHIGSKPREVLISKEDFEEMKSES
ncbi:FtsK/SpoIIIE family DNA translocase [Marinisporobacter balticus]|uniref:DNA translocase FtsK n=1 Tax=Marinisporobacter balticus TaxID=2018667 RepID=A0A4R2L3T1_9FIRM|nr:DNA translocase FtsK [Marinisporobacter balticus]TCO79887.1 DNA translocase FtsK [Marinisporobacter balticus]